MGSHNCVGSEDWLSQAISRREALWLVAQAYMIGRGESMMHDATELLAAKSREIEGDAGVFYERLMLFLKSANEAQIFQNIWVE